MSATSAFIGAFREDSVTASVYNSDEFDEFDARLLRYNIYKARYENTSYRNVHKWAAGLRARYGLGKYIRDIYNPTAQLVNFHTASIWRGSIAPLLIDGAIPLIVGDGTNEDAIRLSADNLMRVSNFEVGKTITTQFGCNLGDAGLKLIDDTKRGQARIEVVDPSNVEDVILDNGIVKGYRLTYYNYDERDMLTKYTETCERGDNEDVIFKTYINDRPSAWPGDELSEWWEPYGFIPFVSIQHNNVGGKWGWAEAHPIQSKIMEVDDQASMLSDYERRGFVSPGLLAGVKQPTNTPTAKTSDATANNPAPGREENKYLYADVGASYTPMISGIDVNAAIANIQNILASIESDMPELRKSIWDISGDPSGIALATAREPVEAKIINRRIGYDSAIVRIIQMGLAIGGWRGYKGYDGFDLTSYAKGLLDISIAQRPVFPEQRGEKTNEMTKVWQGWAPLEGGSIPLQTYLESMGVDQNIIDGLPEIQRMKALADKIPAEGL